MIPPIASNFVAGETPGEAMDHVDKLNDRGVHGILNLLGEHYDQRANADADADAYIDLVHDLADRNTDACISIKPSQIGLSISDDAFEENLARIVDAADCFVWIDMEDHPTTDVTLDAFERHARETEGNVGVCIQANLKRTREDLERLADLPGKVRLVKGAYDEPNDIAYKNKARVDEAYEEYLTYMFEAFDEGIAVGSHDPQMINLATELHDEHGTPFEIQMLMGVREQAQFDLADEGYDVYQYTPYGNKWFSYFYRRIRERKSNALFALRAIIGR
ncbi:proline dehydrogenase family protein [Halobacterium sp. KA-6]|uniref:proline dehydrogenase family protein n=1 Tax=Halobacterium sp. KA-6 TaxID=2896368 RepID=UPI001E4B40C7|nr:proline dehydrogenase family protein [Halobacterium sp. KA-6]MCD2204577.1 proline dehydrogenase family protein [Halobacterium sp. KA-6]